MGGSFHVRLFQRLNKITYVKLLALRAWHIILLKSSLLLHSNTYEHAALFLLNFLIHSTPFYLLRHSGVIFLRSIHCESFFPPFFMVFLLTYRQKINQRGKKLLHSCTGASELQEIRTGEGNKESWTFRQRSNYIFILNRQNIKSLPVNSKLLESDTWGCICKI